MYDCILDTENQINLKIIIILIITSCMILRTNYKSNLMKLCGDDYRLIDFFPRESTYGPYELIFFVWFVKPCDVAFQRTKGLSYQI